AQLILVLWTRDLNAARQRCSRAAAEELFVVVRNIGNEPASIIINLHSGQANSADAIEPEASQQPRVSGILRKLFEQIVPTDNARTFLRLPAAISFVLKKFALRVNRGAALLDWTNHEGVG